MSKYSIIRSNTAVVTAPNERFTWTNLPDRSVLEIVQIGVMFTNSVMGKETGVYRLTGLLYNASSTNVPLFYQPCTFHVVYQGNDLSSPYSTVGVDRDVKYIPYSSSVTILLQGNSDFAGASNDVAYMVVSDD